jgi:hypothetical protein
MHRCARRLFNDAASCWDFTALKVDEGTSMHQWWGVIDRGNTTWRTVPTWKSWVRTCNYVREEGNWLPGTGSGRNSELIMHTNNIVLRVTKDRLITLQFTAVLKFVLHCFTFCAQCLLGGHHPRVLSLSICSFLNPLTPELNPSAQRCLTRFFYWGIFFLNRAFC